MSVLHGWYTSKIDHVLAFPKAPVEREIYMKRTKIFKINEGRTSGYIIKLQ